VLVALWRRRRRHDVRLERAGSATVTP
jgi:hypothetical protein